MNTFCYIFGSGLMDKPYAVEIAVSICVMVMFGYLTWYGYRRAVTVWKEWMSWCVALCGAVVFAAFLSICYFLEKSLRVNEKKQEPFEKVKYEDHEYLIYKDCDCPCRKMINLKK